jgi:DNA-directed RNA polymerase specialized sigma24 family protein
LKALKTELENAIDNYIASYGQLVYMFCYRSLSDSQCAQDMTQEVLTRGWLGGSAVAKTDERLRLLALAYHCCLHVSQPERPATSNRCDVVDVQCLLSALPAETRCLFILQACCALTLEEIVTVTGLPVEQIKAHLIRARRVLAAKLASTVYTDRSLFAQSETFSENLYQHQ